MLALPSPPQGEEKKLRLEMPETESAWKNQRLFVGTKIGIVWQTVSQNAFLPHSVLVSFNSSRNFSSLNAGNGKLSEFLSDRSHSQIPLFPPPISLPAAPLFQLEEEKVGRWRKIRQCQMLTAIGAEEG